MVAPTRPPVEGKKQKDGKSEPEASVTLRLNRVCTAGVMQRSSDGAVARLASPTAAIAPLKAP